MTEPENCPKCGKQPRKWFHADSWKELHEYKCYDCKLYPGPSITNESAVIGWNNFIQAYKAPTPDPVNHLPNCPQCDGRLLLLPHDTSRLIVCGCSPCNIWGAAMVTADGAVKSFLSKYPTPDLVNHPPHYTAGAVECIDAIESALSPEEFRGFLRGQVLKYAFRATRKGAEQQDYAKARWYLDRLIKGEA